MTDAAIPLESNATDAAAPGPTAPRLRASAFAEGLTALVYGYLALSLAPTEDVWSLLLFLHLALGALAALVTAVGLWRRQRWAWFAAVGLTGWIGLPSLALVAQMGRQGFHQPGAGPAVVFSFLLTLSTNGMQLLVLLQCLSARGRHLARALAI